ncbi:hypothetical protein ACJMK2_028974 [Sinanodonta woodiana]|uniref:Transcription cofactor vestigial-like protein 2 n=1 Tax=Sinanodonta woodiana TaxID=1069815 RepID=A0ABD3X8R2_SINWO
MSVDVMYQPYASSFGYQRSSEPFQSLCLPKSQEPLDLGIYPPHSSSLLHHPGASLIGLKDEDKVEQPKDTQYLSANCVLFTYYTGDISSVVDEHFSRALSQPSSYSPENQGSKLASKDPTLMSQRKFPPSFWNSNYYSHGSLYSDFQFPTGHYTPSSLPGFSGLQDPWFSRLSSQSHTFHHRPMHYDFPYSSVSANRYNSNIGSLLLQSSVRSGHFPGSLSGQSDYGKSSDTKFRYPDHRLSSEYAGQSAFPGLDSASTETATNKDLYWY